MSKQTILAIDDSPTILKILDVILKQAGYEVVLAHDGLEGIHIAKQVKPNLIILDFIMPKMNGFQVCKAIRKDDILRNIPIILMSAKGDKVGDKFVDMVGAIDYLTKPFSPELLLSLIPSVIRRTEAQKMTKEAIETAGVEASTTAEKPLSPEDEALKLIRDKAMSNFNSVIDSILKAKNRNEAAEIISDILLESINPEVIDLFKKILWQNTAPIPIGNDNISMRGLLSQVPLPEVFQFAKFQNHTGILKISRNDSIAFVFMRGGSLSFATFVDPSDPAFAEKIFENSGLDNYSIKKAAKIAQNRNTTIVNTIVQEKIWDKKSLYNFFDSTTKSVIYEILNWKDGQFSFQLIKQHTAEVRDIDLGLIIDQLVIDGLRMVDELKVLQNTIRNENQLFLYSGKNITEPVMSQGLEARIAVLMDGTRDLKTIKAMLNISTYELLKSVYNLLNKEYIREIPTAQKIVN